MPILVITVIAEGLFRGKNDGPRLLVPIVNEDKGPVASTFIKLLAEHAIVRETSWAEAVELVRDKHEAPAAIVFPAKLSKQYLQGVSTEIQLLTDPAAGSDLYEVKVLLLLMDKEAAALADPFAEEKITLREENLTGNKLSMTVFEQRVPGFALMFVLLAVVFGTSMSMHDERDNGTLARLSWHPADSRRSMGKLAALRRRRRADARAARLGPWMFGVCSTSRQRAPPRRLRCSRSSRPDRVAARPLARAAAIGLSRDGPLGARRVLVAAVDAAGLDEPDRARRLHDLGDARAERPDPARGRARDDRAAGGGPRRLRRGDAAARHPPLPGAPQRAIAVPARGARSRPAPRRPGTPPRPRCAGTAPRHRG
jgi:hypothetical protein